MVMLDEPPATLSLEEHASNPRFKFFKSPIFIGVLIFFLLLIWFIGYSSYLGYQAYQSGLKTYGVAQGIATAITARNLQDAQSKLTDTKNALIETQDLFGKLSYLSPLPFLGNYYKDGTHAFAAGLKSLDAGELVLSSLAPYADVLGFAGGEGLPEFTSTEDRIIFIATTVEKLAPEMDNINQKLGEVSSELSLINPKNYPEKIGDKEVRAKLVTLQSTVAGMVTSLSSFQPMVKLLPDLLGNPEARKYMLLFQNNAELRPTGGFLTAYATLKVTKGKIEPGVSEDIYTLDSSFKQKVPAPDPIKKYLPLVYTWNLRDMNLSPDFKLSMDTFTKYAKTASEMPEVDAIIAIDTEVPVRLLKVLGPIGVPGFGGKFSAENDPRCNCPQVIYELENIITKPTYEIRVGRKSILGPLMNSMLANIMGSPKSKWPEFFNIFADSIREKHLMMYFYDSNKQNAVEVLQAAGRITTYEGDYLHINDTNFAGAKSNLFVENEVNQEVSIGEGGAVTKKITLTYRNPAPGSNCNLEAGQLCLNGTLRDWIRVYVPKGSVLKDVKGSEVDVTTSEDLGKTVFEGFFTLTPQSVKKLEFSYVTPAGTVSGDNYKLLIQKQGGTQTVKHTISVNGKKAINYSINSDQEIVLPK